MYTYKVEQAIQAAAILHKDHVRKGCLALPYVTHLIATMMILRDYTNDEDTLVAALLHDTLEDTDYTAEELQNDFGPAVHELVTTVTEPPASAGGSWLTRKQQYARQIKRGPVPAAMIAAADKAHNFRSFVEEYHNDHNRFLSEFGSHTAERIEAYQAIANAINAKLKDGIVHEFNHTFTLFKQFLIDVEASQQP